MKLIKLKSGYVNLHIHHSFKLSAGGFYHIPILSFSLGKKGIAIHIIGLMIALGWCE